MPAGDASVTVIAFLRGINVGRNKRIAMADLRALLESLGYADVVTLLNSGNAVFRGPDRSAGEHAVAIEAAIAGRLGMTVRVVVRTPTDLERILASNPLPEALADPSHLLVGFLATPMPPELTQRFDPATFLPEIVRLGGDVVYLWYRDGIGTSKLTIDVLEKRLGSALTARNWTTVTKVLALAAR